MGCRHSAIATDVVCTKPTIYQTASSRTYVFDHHAADIPDNYCTPEIQVIDSSNHRYEDKITPTRRRTHAVDIPMKDVPNNFNNMKEEEYASTLAILADQHQ